VTTTPPVPEPDVKDWTWCITDACPDCRFDAPAVRRAEVPERTRRYTGAIAAALTGPDAARRREPTVWSPVEYACHVRDVCDLFAHRLHRMLTEDDPLFDNWDQDATALEQRYWAQEPAVVAGQLRRNGDRIAEAWAAVGDDQWGRPGRRSNGTLFTVDTFARYFLHDLAHHSWDVTGRPVH
jgi:hypothetical protein